MYVYVSAYIYDYAYVYVCVCVYIYASAVCLPPDAQYHSWAFADLTQAQH